MDVIQICVLLTTILLCDGLSILDQLAHIQSLAQRRNGVPRTFKIMRRFSRPGEPSVILGAPSYPYHLPAAEAILPGHTLIRPAIGMLKSSIKFPHRDQENGAGVYGHINSLGMTYDGKNERVHYTGFRRLQSMLGNVNSRRSASHNPYLQRWQNLEMNLPTREQYSNRHKNPEDTVLGQVIIIKGAKNADFLNIIRIIKSLRRDEEVEKTVVPKKLYVPGTANYGDFDLADSDPETETMNKTVAFWKTKNDFNHIKIRHDAPDLAEFVHVEPAGDERNWWFYHQNDFEQFEER